MLALTKETAKIFEPITLIPSDRLNVRLNDDGSKFVLSIYGAERMGRKQLPSYQASHAFICRIPERKEVQREFEMGQTFECGATDVTAMIIKALWPESQVEMDDEAKQVFDYLLFSRQMQDVCAKNTAAYKLEKKVPAHHLKLNEENPLSGYQQVAAVNALHNEGYCLFMEQGTGKTPVGITTACNLAAKKQKLFRTLIVCPKNVRKNWADEFVKFGTVKTHVQIIRGGAIKRVEQLIDALTIKDHKQVVVIVSYETMSRMYQQLTKLQWDLGIWDEAHYIKWHNSQRTKFSLMMRDFCNRRLLLTGTPIVNTPLDVYTLLEFCNKGGSGFTSWQTFRDFYGVFDRTEHGDKLVALQNMPFMQERLARCAFHITKAEALPELPEKVYDVIEVEMNEKQKEVYEKLRKELIYECEEMMGDTTNTAVTCQNVLTKLLRLAQVTSGFVAYDKVFNDEGALLNPNRIEFLGDNNPKADALVEYYKEMGPKSKLIVWALFTADVNAICDKLTAEGIDCVKFNGSTKDKDRDEAVRLFNEDDSVRVFVGNAAAGGTGLNLLGYPPGRPEASEMNADHTIYYSQGWSPTARWQSGDRNHRRGTRVQVRETDLCVGGTVDEEIRARVLAKKGVALSIADIRGILVNILKGELE